MGKGSRQRFTADEHYKREWTRIFKREKPMRIYIAGPMRGYADYNFPAFFKAAKQVEALGHVAVNPAEKEALQDSDLPDLNKIPVEAGGRNTIFTMGMLHQMDLYQVLDCDAVVLLSGWVSSTGALLEAQVAKICGKKVYLLSEQGVMTPLDSFFYFSTVVGRRKPAPESPAAAPAGPE